MVYRDKQLHDLGKGKAFCYKCHRKEEPAPSYSGKMGTAQVWAVNGFTFNKKYNSLMSYGSDGQLIFWNLEKKAKYGTFMPAGGDPITCGDFSDDGTMVAYGSGYDWHKGAEGAKAK